MDKAAIATLSWEQAIRLLQELYEYASSPCTHAEEVNGANIKCHVANEIIFAVEQP